MVIEYVILRKLQRDPLEKRFLQYRQMSGVRFLVSLREVLNSERILQCRSLLKENVNILADDVHIHREHLLILMRKMIHILRGFFNR